MQTAGDEKGYGPHDVPHRTRGEQTAPVHSKRAARTRGKDRAVGAKELARYQEVAAGIAQVADVLLTNYP